MASFTAQPARPRAGAPRQPNIVLILCDDMGYSDIGCFGGEIRTPNLDRLAAGGMRLTQMYNNARCCPSRASLLTGLYAHQAGIGHMVNDLGRPSYQGYLNDRCVTIAEVLRSGGYRTYMAGKWHVGGTYQPNRPETWRPGAKGFPLPIQRGFDQHYGTLAGAGSYYDPPTLIRNDQLIAPEGDPFYYTDAISDQAVAMIDDAARAGQPFFLYVAYTAPHWPLHALEEDIARYRGAYRIGWDEVRGARYERLRGLGILDARWPASPRDPEAPAWSDLSRERQEWEDARMAVYAAQIDRMDQGIGRIVRRLEDHGLARDTLILFVSDNGGCAEHLAPGRVQRYDIPTRDGRPMRTGNLPGLEPGPADTFMSYDRPWANASNTPFRLYKHWVHEGGIATPGVAWWPAMIPPGAMMHEPVHFIDILPTCLEAAGITYPETFQGHAITPVEGESFLAALRGERWARQKPLVWEHEGNRAVRMGQWKLVCRYPGAWELYDMQEDRTELNDLAARHPSKVKELEDLYRDWAVRVGAVDWGELRRR